MVESKSSLFGIIAIIIGASGLGLGAYSIVNFQVVKGPQGPPGDDGQDGIDGEDGIDGINGTDAPTIENIYFCSSQPEIEDALDTIGTNYGTIIITDSITLTSTLTIDDGGHYIIQGAGFITLDRNADDETLNISNVKSCTIKDIIINASDITSESISGIYISEGNNHPVHIQNIQIGGGDAGVGVEINSENVWIQNCYISGFQTGIKLEINSAYCHILDNLLFDLVAVSGIAYGIHSFSSDFNRFTGNVIRNIKGSTGAFGICLTFYSEFNKLDGNTISTLNGTSGAIGIRIDTSECNTISGNTIDTLISDIATWGFDIMGFSDRNTVIANTASAFQGSNKLFIYLRSDTAENMVLGNTGLGCGGIDDQGAFNQIANNAVS